jgi:hypothetical protein
MEITSKFVASGLLLSFTLIFGLWLSSVGKPYNGLLFNIHKLIALSTVIVAAVQFSKILNNADSLGVIIALLIMAALCVVALFASGALLSMGKLDYSLTLTIHRIALVAFPLTLVLVVYLLGRRL